MTSPHEKKMLIARQLRISLPRVDLQMKSVGLVVAVLLFLFSCSGFDEFSRGGEGQRVS